MQHASAGSLVMRYFMHILMIGTRELVQKQHSEGERHELIVFMLAALAQMRLKVAHGSSSQQRFFGFSRFDGAVYVMIFLIVFLCRASLAYVLCWLCTTKIPQNREN